MKKTLLFIATLALIGAAFFSGCAKKSAEGDAAESADSKLKPNEVVEKVLNGFQTGEADGVYAYFSPSIDRKIIDSYLKEKAREYTVVQFQTGRVKASGKTAVLKYRYSYQGKKKDGTIDYNSKIGKAEFTARLMQEKEGWKIDRFDPALDRKIENSKFLSCAKAVAIARLSQEQFFGRNGTYTRSLSDLRQFTDFDREACRSMDIVSANRDAYIIVAISDTDDKCRITADIKGVKPLRFSACNPSKPVAAGKKAPRVTTVKAAEVQPAKVKVVIEQPPEEERP